MKLFDPARFAADKSGQFALMTALLALPLLIALGVAVDFSRMVDIRSKIQSAADTATLAAVSSSGKTSQKGGVFDGSWTSSQAEAEALKYFSANLSADDKLQVSNPDIDITRTGLLLNASFKADVEVPTTFMSIVGLASQKFVVTSKASASTPPYSDVYVLVDNTPSMGLRQRRPTSTPWRN